MIFFVSTNLTLGLSVESHDDDHQVSVEDQILRLIELHGLLSSPFSPFIALPTHIESEGQIKVSISTCLRFKKSINNKWKCSSTIIDEDGMIMEVPSIYMFTLPNEIDTAFVEKDVFVIGLSVDIGDLVYGQWCEISEITGKDVPNELVDFILDFTGIPRENVKILYSVTLETPRLMDDDFGL